MKKGLLAVIVLIVAASAGWYYYFYNSVSSSAVEKDKSENVVSLANDKYFDVPFKIYGNNIYVRASYKGKVDYWIVDIGWTKAAIAEDLVTDLEGKDTCYKDADTKICTKSYNIDELQLLDGDKSVASIQNFEAYGLGKKEKTATNEGGILGFEIFKDYVIKLDYQKNVFGICDPKYFDQHKKEILEGFNKVDAKAEGHTFRVDTKINGIPVGKMKLDNGSFVIFLSYEATQLKDIAPLRKTKFTEGTLGFGGKATKMDVIKAEVEFGGIKVQRDVGMPDAPFGFTEGSAGDLGFPAFHDLIFILDYPGEGLYIKK